MIWECFFKEELNKFINNDFNNYINWDSSIFSPTFLSETLHISEKIPLTNNKYANQIINIDKILDTTSTVIFDYANQYFHQDDTIATPSPLPLKLDIEEDKSPENKIADNTAESPVISDNSTENENTDIESHTQLYSAMHTNSESFANRVMTPNCDKLSCGDFSKLEENSEFTLCNTFRKQENLSDSDARIGRNWACRYRDESELFLLEFNNFENSNENNTILENQETQTNNQTTEEKDESEESPLIQDITEE